MTKKTLRRIMIWSSVVIILVVAGYYGIKIYKEYVEPYLIAQKYTIEELKEMTDDKKIIEEFTRNLNNREFKSKHSAYLNKRTAMLHKLPFDISYYTHLTIL